MDGDIRLGGAASNRKGRVEIYYDGEWGTVCDDGWDDDDAEVVCRQLWYTNPGARAFGGARYGRGSGPIYLDDVWCSGHEDRLDLCDHGGWENHDCRHHEDASVVCVGKDLKVY